MDASIIYYIIAFLIFILFTIIYPLHKRINKYIIYIILVLNVISDLTSGYFPEGSVHTGIVRAFIMILFLIIMLPKIKWIMTSKIIFIFLIYLMILIPIATDIKFSLFSYLKFFISLMMFPVAYTYFINASLKELKRLNLTIVISMCIITLNFIISQIFNIGRRPYVEDIYIGGSVIQLSFILSLGLIVAPYTLIITKKAKSKIILVGIYFLSLVTMFLMGRRGAIFSFFIGFIIYLLFSKRKTRVTQYSFILVILLFISYPLYEEPLQNIIEHRSKDLEDIDSYGRLLEITSYSERIQKMDLYEALFGKEIFNYKIYLGVKRGLHTIYAKLLYSTGIIGFTMYLLIFMGIILELKKISHYSSKISFLNDFKAIIWAFIIGNLMIDFSGSNLTYRVFFYTYIASLLGVSHNYILNTFKKNPVILIKEKK